MNLNTLTKQDTYSCPYCDAERDGFCYARSGTDEMFQQLKEKHDREHCEKCPTCGQPVQAIIDNIIKDE